MMHIDRRQFVAASARSSAALAGAGVLLRSTRTAQADQANDKIVLALIGAGGRGSSLIRSMTGLENVEAKYVCDVNASRGQGVIGALEQLQGYAPRRVGDMREVLDDRDVDAVVIATPEHWHALATVWACQAGKDVYVEKNVSISIWEGRKMIEAARKHERVVQAGTQNRSAPYGRSAREYIESGRLGKVVHVKVYNMLGGGKWSPSPDGAPPAGLDWDRWLGPAPEVPYNPGRMRWYSWWDYSGGAMAGDASHQLDLARMVLGDPPHPKTVCCAGGNFAFGSQRQTPEMQAITYEFGDFAMTCENATFAPYMKKTPGDARYGDKFPSWPQNATRIEIYGAKQLMYVGRHGGGWQVLEADGKQIAHEYGYHPDKWHQPDFFECIRSRGRPNADVEQAHLSACLVHLGNLSYRVGNRQLVFDANSETFPGDEAANRLLKPEYRKHYRIPDEV
ncbi:MAG: Gfo/Idh/MocA family protein [Planctomycetota bacterium]|jgi:predicted dehydrogenase